MQDQVDMNVSGYRKWVSHLNQVLKGTDTLYQKRITDEKGIRYFVDAWYYPSVAGTIVDDRFQFEVQFTLPDGEKMNVMSFYKEVDKSEQLFDLMWNKLELGYYEEWGE